MINCSPDYFKYCSQYSTDSEEVRNCFRQNGKKLSLSCVNALLSDGEVTPEEVKSYNKEEEPPKPVEPEPVVKQEEVPIATPQEEVKKETYAKIIIGKVINKTKTVSKKIKVAIKTSSNPDKWKGYPLFLESYSNVPKDTMGSTITNYGIYDRIRK